MIKPAADWLVYTVFGLDRGSLFAEALDFFLYDTAKIFLLLAVIIFIVSFVRTFFPPEKTRAILGRKNRYAGHVLAALFGIVTPFCTCSAIPLFLGFIEAGVPLGVTFSFLVASPMINEIALVMLWGLFGWKIALIYIASGLVIAIISGIIIGMMKPEGLLIAATPVARKKGFGMLDFTVWERARISRDYTGEIIRKIWPYVVGGIAVGAWIHGYVPQEFLARVAGKGNVFAVPVATVVGIPLYSNAAGMIPMVSALVEKGVSMGTALAFMMAVTGLSLPEFLILKKVMRLRLILLFAAVVGCGIIFTGYMFNFLIR